MDWQNTKDRMLLVAVLIIAVHAIFSYVYEFYWIFKSRRTSYRRYLDEDFNLTSTRYIKRRTIKMLMICFEFMIVISYTNLFFVNTNSTDNTDISTRIENISQDLASSSTELSIIQQELEERIKYVEDLKVEAEIAENVISLTDEQVNAVQAKLNQELEANSTKGMVQNILVATFFFVLGYIVQSIPNWIKRKTGRTTGNKDVTPHTQYSAEEIEQAIMLLSTIKQKEKFSEESR